MPAQTCYRHPNRETGVSCSSCGRPICPECMTPTPVGMRCPECAKQRTKVRSGPAAYSTEPMATYVLIAANVIVALGVAAGGAGLSSNYLASEIGRQGTLFGPWVADGD